MKNKEIIYNMNMKYIIYKRFIRTYHIHTYIHADMHTIEIKEKMKKKLVIKKLSSLSCKVRS